MFVKKAHILSGLVQINIFLLLIGKIIRFHRIKIQKRGEIL